MPPEAWTAPARNASADVFSFGVLAYEALTGKYPFAVPPVLLARAGQPLPVPPRIEGLPETCAALVEACLREDPSKRPIARELAQGL
jgi:serine/threonine protein kinase